LIFLDIYDFGYVDFKYLWKMYWNDIKDEHVARVSINRRMKKLTDANYIYPIPFRSINNESSKGRVGNVFTLAGKGISHVEGLYGEKEIIWDPNKKYRKGAYIEHHLSVAHLTKQAKINCPEHYEMDYRGERDAAYRIDMEHSFKNVFLPDSLWFFKKVQVADSTPVFVEYERTIRRSEKKMIEKIKGQNDYFIKGFYKEHDVLRSYPTDVPPVLIYISNENRTNISYQRLIATKYQTWYQKGFYCSDLLFATLDDFSEDPYGLIFKDFGNRKKSILQAVNLAAYGHNYVANMPGSVKWLPSYLASQKVSEKQFLNIDGLVLIKKNEAINQAVLVSYISKSDFKKVEELSGVITSNDLSKHQLLVNSIPGNSEDNPKLVFLIEDEEQKDKFSSYIRGLDWGEQIGQLLIVNVGEAIEDPVNAKYLDVMRQQETFNL
ncbi:hypothetical protein, partial [Anaerosolibacter sp.]|uniref:hypothetical protein n=1 Tax=Anaerosolibacter sp. TaxID=1872527 RepID=UPI0039F0DC6C